MIVCIQTRAATREHISAVEHDYIGVTPGVGKLRFWGRDYPTQAA
jgi:hypothetical protein